MNRTCSHGMRWDEACNDCTQVTLAMEMRDLIRDCEMVAKALTDQPGLASDPSVVIDLYRTIQRLAAVIGREVPPS